ncbi:FtsH protease activity modulator HflK [Oxalobacter sp. OttesenSCG-928-P03]|nr:FtsH protease activity modulator HflK [Oxalobacter sp. OttesenSCG-928-P03]
MFHDLFGRGSGDYDHNDPPEIDRIWNNFNKRLNRLFKRKGKGGDDQGGDDDSGRDYDDEVNKRKGLRFALVMVAVVGFLFWMGTGVFIVQEGETGVVMTFGRYSHMTSSGVNWRYPSPIQSHEVVNVSQVRTVEVGYRSTLKNKQPKEALMLTNDENIIDIQFAVQYRLKSAADWVFNNRDQEEMVRQVAETSIREIVGRNKMDFVLYEGRDQIAMDTQVLMQEIFDQYQAGVQITNVTMQGVQPPEQVQAAFDDAVKAGQDRERQKNEGEAYANGVIPRAKGTAARLIQEAEGYRDQVIANAEGNAARFKMIVAEYQKAPGVTRDRMYLETMQEIFSNTTKLMMDVKSGSNLLYLPFDKLMSQSAAQSQLQQSSAPNSDAQVLSGTSQMQVPVETGGGSGRSRESRDRGGR